MRLINCKDPNISFALIPWYIPLTQTRLEIGWELHERLRQFPEDTLCGVFYENGIRGMFVVYCRYDDVFIWQANAPKNKYVKMILDTVIAWAKAKGFNKIRLITKREKPMAKRFSFVVNGLELERSI
jgi:hypothetical protein